MEYLEINGGAELGGEIFVHGAKNSVLPILAGSVLISGKSVIHNCPELSDVLSSIDILESLGAKVKKEGKILIIDSSNISKSSVNEAMMKTMRSSIIFLGALVGRTGDACLFLPGGCEIGLRPIDLHIKALKSLGYDLRFDGSNICCNNSCAKAAKIVLPIPSVGATENAILASVLLRGKTTIINAAREPEIEDLANFLNSAGAKISGASTPVIEITGVESLHSTEHTVIFDRILASTYLSAAAITKSELMIKNVNHIHIAPNLPPFYEMGCKLYPGDNSIGIKPPRKLRRVKKTETGAFPGFPTDSQAPLMAALTVASGSSIIKENIFENRFKHISQLERFGADITALDSRVAIVNGVKELYGAEASCTDLRGGAAIVIEALAAQGVSVIKNIEHIDRGYESIEESLSSIGARIKRIKDEEGSKKQLEKES
ncbi:MAG: UDP-N-acetylglucosamine 1-carboxyvinyltransferase [Eubacterium sp.]|nr:UDP-N-acetylglucosamine 1-carboxyvinyltransferase [Eubacterium sp.]